MNNMAINFNSRGRIESLPKLTEGGEAALYEYKGSVLKIYKNGVNLSKKETKVKALIANRNKFPTNVIAPEDIVTVNGTFVGYSMKKLTAIEDFHMLTKPKFLNSQGLDNKDVLEIVLSLGKDLEALHKLGILVGDISDYNFQVSGKRVYFVDVDSWGVGKYSPDAYTELFTDPDAYQSGGCINFSHEGENYSFAVLAFNMLTRLHPFGGVYMKDKSLSILDRMKRKISVLGKHKADIKIPKVAGDWTWMSPELQEKFLAIFENGNKDDITPELEELYTHLSYCRTHRIHYYSKYSECPLCNANAKIKTTPTIIKIPTRTGGPVVTVVFTGTDCVYIISPDLYINSNNEAVHMATGRKFAIPTGMKVEFSKDGKLAYVIGDDFFKIYNAKNQLLSTISRSYKSNYVIDDKMLYYVEDGGSFVCTAVSEKGNRLRLLGTVYNPLIAVADNGDTFTASMYPKKMIVTTKHFNFEVPYTGTIREYAIKFDRASHKWLFVYQLPNGKYRTMVFDGNKIIYDEDTIIYNAQTLSNIEFFGNTIYDPDNGKIIGTNIVKNVAKEFTCSVVDEASRLEFTGRGFRIYNSDTIYDYA